MIKHCLIGFLLSTAMVAIQARAQNVDESCERDCVEVGAWRFNVGLGVGVRSNPLHQGDDAPLVLLPEASYYGERFFLKNLEMGFTLFEDSRHQLNILLTPGYDQMYFNRWDPFNFTDGGGVFASTSSGGGPTAAANYTVNISSQPQGIGAGGQAPADVEGASSGVTIPTAQGIIINDQVIAIDAGAQMLFGSEGNAITVLVEGDVINISGVVAGDSVVLNGVQVEDIAAIEGRGGASVTFTDPSASLVGDSERTVSIGLDDRNGYLVSTGAPFDGIAASDRKIPAKAVAHRRMAGLGGLEYSYSLQRMSLHLQALTDVTGVHEGQEVRLAAIFPWHWGEQKWALTVGANYKSRKILDYYYGIHSKDVVDNAWLFTPASAGIERMVRLDWQRPLSRHWSLRAMLQYSELPGEIHTSPLVSDDHVGSVFFGGVYHF